MPEEYDGVINKPPLDDVLEHHGVKGQKWGIRKQRPTLGLARRRVNTGTAQSSTSKYTKNAKNRKGYSSKDYQKYRKRGISHAKAIEYAKRDRKKKIAGIAIGAAAIGLTALAIKKGKATNNTALLEKRYQQNLAKQQNAWKSFKFKNDQHYAGVRTSLLNQKLLEAEQKAGHQIDPKTIRINDEELRKHGYRMQQLSRSGTRNMIRNKFRR